MVTVTEMPVSEPVAVTAAGHSVMPASRAVAVAVTPLELLRPESDLVRLAAGFSQVEVLFAADDESQSDDLDDDLDDARLQRVAAELSDGVARLQMPGLALHRLGLSAPLPTTAEDDLVAALSELIGFDPEPGVYCLAPAPEPGDPARSAVERAVHRIVQVYGIPLLRYRCPELAVVCG